MPFGTLYLLPVPLSADAAAASYTPYLTQVINSIDEYIVENEKTARKFLKQAGLRIPQSEYSAVSEAMRDGNVINQDYEENDVILKVDLSHALAGKLKKYIL